VGRNRSIQDKGLKFLRTKKVVTQVEMALHLHCSPRTVQRRFAQWQAINSYDQNGSCYTLPDIPTFDANGLWQYRGASFSRFGNLPDTFVGLVANSQSGLRAAEAGELMGVRPSSFLWSLREHPDLVREKYQGLYVYFCSAPTRYDSQRRQRSLMRKATRLPTDSEAIAILVEKIKHPAQSSVALSKRLRKLKLSVEPGMIDNLFVKHGLAVKKTPPSA
jgi:hypothetical protein